MKLQEQSYYPFGLQMSGISDQALGKLDSKNKFNGGVEIEEDYGVNLYSTFYRKYDPQIGRFSGVDCQSESSIGMSVYQFGGNNPVSYNDPLGNKATSGYYSHPPGYVDYSLRDPNPNHRSQFLDAGEGGGGGGRGGVYSFGSDGFSLTGDAAVNFFSGLTNAINSSDDGNWSFMAGTNKNGQFGYWQSYGFTSSPAVGAEILAGVGVGQQFISLDGPGPKNKFSNNLLINAALTMQQSTKFDGDLFGFGVGPSLSRGPFKFDASFGIVETGKGLKANLDASATVYGNEVNWQMRYHPSNGDLSHNTNLVSIGLNTESWSVDLFFIKAYGDYQAATDYLKGLGETFNNYFNNLFYLWSHPYENK